MVRCINCDREYEHELDHEEVDEIELVEQDDGPPRMQIGVDSHDVWRCKGCGKVLGSGNAYSVPMDSSGSSRFSSRYAGTGHTTPKTSR